MRLQNRKYQPSKTKIQHTIYIMNSPVPTVKKTLFDCLPQNNNRKSNTIRSIVCFVGNLSEYKMFVIFIELTSSSVETLIFFSVEDWQERR